jgi:hypothetical protein
VLNPLTHRKVLSTGVRGRASVVEMGALDRDAASFNLAMTLQVYVDEWTPYEVEDQWMVKAADVAGLSGWIPVRVDPDDLQRVAIDWDGVRAAREHEKTARREVLAHGGAVGEWSAAQRIDLQLDPEAGLYQPGQDTLTRLERLGALRTTGVLTDDEFQAQKRRILSGG